MLLTFSPNIATSGDQIQKEKEKMVPHGMSNRFVDDLDKRKSFIYEGSGGIEQMPGRKIV